MSIKTNTKTDKPVVMYREGSLFDNIKGLSNVLIAHVANDLGIMGGGFVVPLAKAFPIARKEYLNWHAGRELSSLANVTGKFALGETQFVIVDIDNEVVVANMVSQHRIGSPPRPLRYNALVKCMEAVANFAPSIYTMHCPLFGSVLAGGRWEFIAELIQDCWLDRGFNVTIHYLAGQLPQGFGS